MLNQNNGTMKKNIGFNIMLFGFIINLILILSCSENIKNQSSGTLLLSDRNFSAMSVQEGMFRAFLFYIAGVGFLKGGM